MRRGLVDQALEEAKVLGIRNILALRGDPPRDEEYRLGTDIEEGNDSNEEFTWAIDLVRYIRRKHGNYFCIGVAAYPEGHSDLSHPNDQDTAKDLPFLVDKIKAGADFIMTQLFYDVKAYLSFEKLLLSHESGAFEGIPIIPGLMPIQSFETIFRVTKLSHAKLPLTLYHKLQPFKGDDEAVKKAGVDALCEIVEEIRAVKSPRPRGFHFYTLNLEKAVMDILSRCQLIQQTVDDFAISEHSPSINGGNGGNGDHTVPDRRFSISSASSAVAQLKTNEYRSSSPTRLTVPSQSTRRPSTTQEATWDDFPNGRFGDARSPAFNPPLSYSPTCESRLFSSIIALLVRK